MPVALTVEVPVPEQGAQVVEEELIFALFPQTISLSFL
jgi:hypothetical protein